MEIGQFVRIVLLILLVLLAQYQLSIRDRPSPITTTAPAPPSPRNLTPSATAPSWQTAFDLSFPLVTTPIPSESDISWATAFLRLPTWSAGYERCDSNLSEVSCFEVVRAARAIESWEKSKFVGQVWVEIGGTALPDRLSMLYHGLQIALATNRSVVTDTSRFAGFSLPKVIVHSTERQAGNSLPTDYQFGCADVSPRFPNVQFSGASWPQALYTHPVVAPFLRANFGYHAAHFLGNYLYGTKKVDKDCTAEREIVIEGWNFAGDADTMRPGEYVQYVGRCGVDSLSAVMVANSEIPAHRKGAYGEVWTIGQDDAAVVCALRKLMSAKRIIHTFGSRIGFWATAMLGVKGGFVNGIDRICINTTNSQQGSLWHTFVPPEKPWFYRTNTWFYVCGPNVNDARLYVEYLLW
jgi:hypothetical protein